MRRLLNDERFTPIAETIVDGFIVIDVRGHILFTNSACVKLFGYSTQEMVGRNVRMLMTDDVGDMHDDYLKRHRETKVRRIIGMGREIVGRRKSGESFPMHLSVGESGGGDDKIFVGVIYDLSEKRKNEEILLHHQKLDALGRLAGGMAHDFANLVNVIESNLEIVSDHELPSAARRAVSRAIEASKKAGKTTQRLLMFSRRQSVVHEVLDLNALLSGMQSLLQQAVGESVSVDMSLCHGRALARVDEDQFETAILNLAVNARDAMPDGGVFSVRTALTHTPGQADQKLRLDVSDAGLGMSPEICRRAFDPFFTTKDVGAGAGLGLSMVYGFVKQIGGHVELSSAPGRGTTFSFEFPLADTVDEKPAVKEAPALKNGRSPRVLIVEDDPEVRAGAEQRFKSFGCQVTSACNASDAMAMLEESAGQFDLVFSDITMPGGLSGVDIARYTRERFPNVPILLTTGYSSSIAEASEGLGVRVLQKPYSRSTLAAAVSEILA